MRIKLLILVSFMAFYSNAQQILFEDKASNYSTWINGSNLGTGFTAWDLWTQNTDASNFAGHFLGNSAAQGFGDINSTGQSFGMYGNPTGIFPQANAQRFLNNTGSVAVGGRQFLLPGQTFTIDLAVAYRNGYKGIDLMDQNFGLLFNFNVQNDLYTTSTSSDLTWIYNQSSVFTLKVNQTDVNAYEVVITRGAEVYNSGSRVGQFSGFKLYVGNTSDSNNLNNLFFNNIQVQTCAMTTTWNGTSWDKGLPNANKNVVFSGNYSSTGSISACSVQVSNNAVVTINSGHTLTIANNLTVDTGATLQFENTSSLIQTNASAINTGNIIYKRNSAPMRLYEYTYWSTPVSNQQMLAFSPLTDTDKFFTFNTVANNWQGEDPLTNFLPAKGYAVRAPENFNTTPQVYYSQFVGVPNNGNYSTPVVAYDAMLGNYNFLGNPYPSAISVASLIDNSSLGSLYFWTHNTAISGSGQFTSDDYAVRTKFIGTAAVSGGATPGAYISAGQGFFASSNATTNVTFTNAMRVSGNNTQFYRQNQIITDPQMYFMWLNMTNSGGAFKQLAVGYLEGATDGFDNGIDAPGAAGTYINFYTMIAGNPYAINGLEYPWNTLDVIPLGYSSTIASDFTFAIDHTDTFFDDKEVYLVDNITNTYQNLKTGNYTFTSAIGTFNSRFHIQFTQPVMSAASFEYENSVVVSKNLAQLQIYSGVQKLKNIQIFDLTGRLIMAKDVNSNLEKLELDSVSNQAIIIKVKLENDQIITKKYIY
jgi:hypothetical protein